MSNELFDINELVRVYLKPPYLTTKTGIPIIPSNSIVTIYVRGELYQEYYTTANNGTPAGLNMHLFNIRALARNKGANSKVYIETSEMTTEYAYVFNKKKQDVFDVTDWFPHPTYIL